jgi:hypothetical protein
MLVVEVAEVCRWVALETTFLAGTTMLAVKVAEVYSKLLLGRVDVDTRSLASTTIAVGNIVEL